MCTVMHYIMLLAYEARTKDQSHGLGNRLKVKTDLVRC